MTQDPSGGGQWGWTKRREEREKHQRWQAVEVDKVEREGEAPTRPLWWRTIEVDREEKEKHQRSATHDT